MKDVSPTDYAAILDDMKNWVYPFDRPRITEHYSLTSTKEGDAAYLRKTPAN